MYIAQGYEPDGQGGRRRQTQSLNIAPRHHLRWIFCWKASPWVIPETRFQWFPPVCGKMYVCLYVWQDVFLFVCVAQCICICMCYKMYLYLYMCQDVLVFVCVARCICICMCDKRYYAVKWFRLDMGGEQQRERRDLEPTGPPDRTYKVTCPRHRGFKTLNGRLA